jgi:hypothetical protein
MIFVTCHSERSEESKGDWLTGKFRAAKKRRRLFTAVESVTGCVAQSRTEKLRLSVQSAKAASPARMLPKVVVRARCTAIGTVMVPA